MLFKASQDKEKMENSLVRKVLDSKGQVHIVTGELGRGGQGIVYKTIDPNVIIKMLVSELGLPTTDDKVRYTYEEKINRVKVIPFPKQVNLATPVDTLAPPHIGYTMQMLTGMVPLEKDMKQKEGSLLRNYLNTGGLKRRLLILKKLSSILAYLQMNNLVYGDLSPNNVFVSSAFDQSEVWLIDPDNICDQLDFSHSVQTPGYSSPEVYSGAMPNTIYSDVYSFAILAYELLTARHPFEGDRVVNGGGWEDEGHDCYDLAYKGEIPWVGDLEDNSNPPIPGVGIPHEWVISPVMFDLFGKTFSYEGRKKPLTRPAMLEWHKCLSRAVKMVVTCEGCGSTYFLSNNCPFCDTNRKQVFFTTIKSLIKDEFDGNLWKTIETLVLDGLETGGKDTIKISSFVPRLAHEQDTDVVELFIKNDRLMVRNILRSNNLYVKVDDKYKNFSFEAFGRSGTISLAYRGESEFRYLTIDRV